MFDTDDNEGVASKPRNNNNGEGVHAEKLLSNGDFYTGLLSDNLPHGTGKYLWTDGCMYEGDWFEGKTTGKGKFSWPSGATYEGDFKNGFMDGFGTYIGNNGATYRGLWAMNLKHGFGQKRYDNGDYYEGPWKSGFQDGHGRYVWKNGKEYNGEWKNGVICGRGTLILADGNKYEGNWEDGLPKGYGIFTWIDGSSYIGTWSRDPKEQRGVLYPSPSSADCSNSGWTQQEVYSVILNDCLVCPGEEVSILPSQKTLNWSGIKADFLQKQAVWRSAKYGSSGSIMSKKSSLHRTSSWQSGGDGVFDPVDVHPGTVPTTPKKVAGEYGFNVDLGGAQQQQRLQKKQGVTISKGHKNYDLMLSLQLGIRHSVGKPAPSTSHDLRPSAFDPKEKVWTRFPPEGSKYTPPHQSVDFRWKDYCALVFRYLRHLFKIDAADYMLSICGNDALRELSSPGKSGSFFYMTHDDHYMIKTVKKAEVKVLLRMLPSYYNHVRAYENTLVTKFFGLHCVKLAGATQKKVRFIIMGNLFCSKYNIHRIFDLKGSSHGRTTSKPESEIDETTTLKDLDLKFIFRLQRAWFQELCRQVERDCEFLEAERIMDYSLLVGIHFTDISCPRDTLLYDGTNELDQGTGRLSRVEARDIDHLLLDPNWWSSIRLGVNMPARVEKTVRRSDCENQLVGEPTGEMRDVILFFGIIDILQDYDITKKLENAYKSIQYDPTTISAVDPRQYAKRFRDFMYRIFFEDI